MILIGRVGKNKRAARTYEQVSDIRWKTTRSLSNHDDEANMNLINLHIWQKKKIFARFARAFFIFAHLVDVLVLVKWPNLRLSGRRDHRMLLSYFGSAGPI